MKKLPTKRRILIVGEGRETEYNYFVGFRNVYEKELQATATSVRVARGKGGNATNIVENAIKEKKKFEPKAKLGDRVFLLLDTEGTGRAPELPAAEKLAKKNEIEIIYSCPAIEYWLLCHFQNVSRGYFKDCATVVAALNKEKTWKSVCKTEYDKSDQDIFDRVKGRLDEALSQALEIDIHHEKTTGTALRTNPSTQVYELISILIGVQTGKKCPMEGRWKLIGNPNETIQLLKGEKMPVIKGEEVRWQF